MKQTYKNISFENIYFFVSDLNWSTNCFSCVNIPLKDLSEGLKSEHEAILLHEMGHIELHKKNPNLNVTYMKVMIEILMYEFRSYNLGLNLFNYSKDEYSKTIAKITLLSWFLYIVCGNIHERAADDFACKHGTKEALYGLKEWFEAKKLDTYKNLGYLDRFFLNVGLFILDVHPFYESRIRKVEKALTVK